MNINQLPNKSYESVEAYEKTLKLFKKFLTENKGFEIESIDVIKDDIYTKEKVRVKINTHNKTETYHDLIVLFDIYTQYEVWSGYSHLLMRIDVDDVKKDIERIIKELI